MANPIMYCPFCEKYESFWSQFCSLCGRKTIVSVEWEKMNDYEREHWKHAYEEPRHVSNVPFGGDRQLEKDFYDFDSKVRRDKEDAENKKATAIKEEQARKQYTPKCPTCGCPDIEKIGAGEKVASAAMWGLLSRKIHKQFRCKNCGYEW